MFFYLSQEKHYTYQYFHTHSISFKIQFDRHGTSLSLEMLNHILLCALQNMLIPSIWSPTVIRPALFSLAYTLRLLAKYILIIISVITCITSFYITFTIKSTSRHNMKHLANCGCHTTVIILSIFYRVLYNPHPCNYYARLVTMWRLTPRFPGEQGMLAFFITLL